MATLTLYLTFYIFPPFFRFSFIGDGYFSSSLVRFQLVCKLWLFSIIECSRFEHFSFLFVFHISRLSRSTVFVWNCSLDPSAHTILLHPQRGAHHNSVHFIVKILLRSQRNGTMCSKGGGKKRECMRHTHTLFEWVGHAIFIQLDGHVVSV